MTFDQAEQLFRALERQLAQGQITTETYRTELQQLCVVGPAGRTWSLQERTGVWFVWDQGAWQEAQPPRAASSHSEPTVVMPAAEPSRAASPLSEPTIVMPAARPPIAAEPTIVMQPATPPEQAAEPLHGRRRHSYGLLIAGGLVIMLAICAGLVIGGWKLLGDRNTDSNLITEVQATLPADTTEVDQEPGQAAETPDASTDPTAAAPAPDEEPSTAEPEPEPEQPAARPGLGLTLLETLPVPADDAPVSDGDGVALQVTSGSLADGQNAQIQIHQAVGELAQALEYAYVIETPFYAVNAQDDDSVGRATLTFPAADPSSRIVAVFDEEYPVMLDVVPESGVLTLHPRLGPADTSGQEQVGSLAPGGSLHYVVIHPKEETSRRGAPGPAAPPADEAQRPCLPKLDPLGGVNALCAKNSAGTVFVHYSLGLDHSQVSAAQVADSVATMMQAYADLGFTAAKLTPSSPAYVRLVPGGGDPSYLVTTGVIHLPFESAKQIASGKAYDLVHEMGHWIQDEEYNMSWAYWRGHKTWWLEVAAENMVMLIDPAYLDQNLSEYGVISVGSTLAFQHTPYQWPGEFYVHAQLVKLMMCDDPIVCPLSQAGFVQAINEGSYPFEDSGSREKLSNSLDAYARYLLGATPGRGNPALQAERAGAANGEFVNIAEGVQQGAWTLTMNGVDPQMVKGTERDLTTATVDAPLQKDGVYPFSVTSGVRDGAVPGLPAKLTISPGAPFWYRTGDNEPILHDGTTELVLQPIQAVYGLPSVRVVALGRQGGQRFQAKVEYVDLAGTWLIGPENLVSNNIVCTATDPESDTSQLHMLAPGLITYGNLFGAFEPDAGDNSLTWALVGERLPQEVSADDFTYEAAAVIGTQDIQLQAAMSIPDTTTSRSDRPSFPVWATLTGVLPLALVMGYRRRRPNWIAPTLLGLTLVTLVGCGVFVGFYGDATAVLKFDKLEYVGGQGAAMVTMDDQPAADPLWRLSGGTGTYELDFTVVAGATDTEGNTEQNTSHCTGSAVFEIAGAIYTDAVVQLSQP